MLIVNRTLCLLLLCLLLEEEKNLIFKLTIFVMVPVCAGNPRSYVYVEGKD